MTPAQLQKIKDDMAADPVFSTMPHTGDNAFFIAAEYNKQAVPDFWGWRNTLSEQEVYEATSHAGSKWNWATYKAQTVQDRDSWARMFNPGSVNPALQQTRDGWLAIFGGQGASQQQVNFLLALSQFLTTRGEKLLATGAGTIVSAADLGFYGLYQPTDIEQAWALV